MYVRCAHCLSSLRLKLGSRIPVAYCPGCGRGLRLERAPELGSTPHERYRRALDFSEEHDIDLASAYSALLGIMTLDQCCRAKVTLRPRSPKRPSDAADSGSPTTVARRKLQYDASFFPAVSEGWMTEEQAYERGDRVAYASRVASECGLPMSLAFLVADNQLSVDQASARNEARPALRPATSVAGSRTAQRSALAPSLLVLVLSGLATVGVWQLGRRPDSLPRGPTQTTRGHPTTTSAVPVGRRAESSAEVRRSAAGQPVRIIGASPREVLHAYCQSADSGEALEPVDVARSRSGYTGIFRQRGFLFAIEIRPSVKQEGRWITGNGRDAIVTTMRQRPF